MLNLACFACFLVGCALKCQRIGLVRTEGSKVEIIESTGRVNRLAGGDDHNILAQLHGYGVEVAGPRLAKTVLVRSWRVFDGGDGSQPYLGTLSRHGLRWMLDDRQSGARYILAPESLGELVAHEGEIILVVGFIVGPHKVYVVHWQALGES